jgi:hypothetical protein
MRLLEQRFHCYESLKEQQLQTSLREYSLWILYILLSSRALGDPWKLGCSPWQSWGIPDYVSKGSVPTVARLVPENSLLLCAGKTLMGISLLPKP